MRRLHIVLVLAIIVSLFLTACGGKGEDNPYALNYVKAEKRMVLINGEDLAYKDYILVYTEFENHSSQPVTPSEVLEVHAYVGGKEMGSAGLSRAAMKDDSIKNYLQSNIEIAPQESAKIVWAFDAEGDGQTTVKMDTGKGTEEYNLE